MNTVEKTVMIEQGGNGPPADMRRAALAGSPDRESRLPCIVESTEAVTDIQARSLRRRFTLAYCVAAAFAPLVWGLPR